MKTGVSKMAWLGFGFVLAQGVWRYREQMRLPKVVTKTGVQLEGIYDLRDSTKISKIQERRESDAFRERVRRPSSSIAYWPGLKAAQASWVWMQTLSGLHVQSSYEGDYSWLFSKLNFLSRAIGKNHDPRVVSIAPFFLVIGSDGIGSTMLLQDWIRNYPDSWKTWFFAGFHALDNLKIPKLAADYYTHAIQFSQTPDYVAALVVRLKSEGEINDKKNRDLLIEGLDPNLVERLKRIKPEWFQF